MTTTYIDANIETKEQALLREFYFLTTVSSPEYVLSSMKMEALEWLLRVLETVEHFEMCAKIKKEIDDRKNGNSIIA